MTYFYLYRHFDKAGNLLYVGKTNRPWPKRMREHQKYAPWFLDIANVSLEVFLSEGALSTAEIEAIQKERPLHNKHYVLVGHQPTVTPEPAPPRVLGDWLNYPIKSKVGSALWNIVDVAEYYGTSTSELEAWAHALGVGMADWDGKKSIWGKDARRFGKWVARGILERAK